MPIQEMQGAGPKPIPVIFLIDTSGSMQGLGIQQVNVNLKEYIDEMKNDPETKESVQITIVTFDSSARVIIDFEPVTTVVTPTLVTGGSTDLARGIRKVMEVVQAKADFIKQKCRKPLLVFMSDGNPDSSCNWSAELDQMNADYIMKRAIRVALGAGSDINDDTLSKFILNKELDRSVKIASVEKLSEFFKYLRTITKEMSVGKPLSTPLQAGASDVNLVGPNP